MSALFNIGGIYKAMDSCKVNIGGVWKEVVRISANIGGAWKDIFKPKEVKYYGTAPDLSEGRTQMCGGAIGNYALFSGGYYRSGTLFIRTTVDAYNNTLARTTATAMSGGATEQMSANSTSHVLFAGGRNSVAIGQVNAYDGSLTRTALSVLNRSVYLHAGASAGQYALFAGGTDNSSTYADLTAYNSSLTKSTPTSLSEQKKSLVGASINGNALFAGGMSPSDATLLTINAYNSSLVRSVLSNLSNSSYAMASVSTTNYVLFTAYNTTAIDVYDASLVKGTPVNASVLRYGVNSGDINKEYAVFANGSASPNVVDVFDSNLVRTNPTNLPAVYSFTTASVGNYILFGGGSESSAQKTVYAYEVI